MKSGILAVAAASVPAIAALSKPIGVTQSGGGYRSLFNGVGFGRAMAENNLWSEVSHLASNSGGTWFMAMLQYSQGFYDDLTNLSKPLDELVNDIAGQMEARAQEAVDAGNLTLVPELEFTPWCKHGNKPNSIGCNTLKATCATTVGIATLAINSFLNAHLLPFHVNETAVWDTTPFVDWAGFIEQAVLGAVSPASYGDVFAPVALLHAAWVVSTGMIVDTFLDEETIACLVPQTSDATSAGWLAPNGAARTEWPAAFVRGATVVGGVAGESGWRFGDAVDSFATAIIEPSTTCADADLSAASALELPVTTLSTARLTSWSSGAPGFATSPTQFGPYAENIAGSLAATALKCYPGTTEDGAGPGAETVGPLISDDAGQPIWRGNDGGTTDNFGISHLIGRMQDDCEAGTLDCSDGLNIVVLDTDTYDMFYGALRLTFMQPNLKVVDPGDATLSALWKSWLSVDASVYQGNVAPSEADEQPQYWQGTLTTVANRWFGVRAGWKVNALIFRPQLDQQTFLPVFKIAPYVASKYAPAAAAIARDAAPILKDFFHGILNPSSVGDPTTSYLGRQTRYWLSSCLRFWEHFTAVFEQGPFVLSQLAGPVNPPLGLEAHKGHWVVAMELNIAGLDTIHIETIDPMALLELPDATAPIPATDALTTMRLSTSGKQLTAGHHVLSTFDTTITASRVSGPALQEMSIGSGFVEQIDVKAIGLHIRITSSKANKFVDEKFQVLGLHLDLEFLTIDESAVRGALPEMWGLQPMSEATKLLLEKPTDGN